MDNINDLIPVIHTALDTYPVLVYNGSETPVPKPLPEALTHISLDVRNVKLELQDQATLLQGAKKRKQLKEYFKKITDTLGEYTIVKSIVWIVMRLTSIYGLINLAIKLFS